MPIQTWQTRGACAQHADPDLWYASHPRDIADAQRICQACDVRLRCLAQALSSEEGQHGIWGGYTLEQRRKIAADIRRLRGESDARDSHP